MNKGSGPVGRARPGRNRGSQPGRTPRPERRERAGAALAQRYDVVVVGSRPNGLSAAVTLARAGLARLVVEAADTPGGGARTEELTLPGFRHDVCSTVHPLGIASPFLRQLRLERHGVEWCQPPLALAHVLRDGSAVRFCRSLSDTAASTETLMPTGIHRRR